ncbi:MAG: hypothetical protein E3J96_00355 [Sulfurovum sp.]|nr:MAG: hypothetical protein E3J96_00355 [Sulfurovum sp.]
MALFNGNKKKSGKNKHSNINTATIVTACTEITGDLKGSDTVHIDGTLHGNIIVDNMVVVGKSGIINGNIKAQKIMVNGNVKGSMTCVDLEIMQSGKVSHRIDADKIILDGEVEGTILAKTSINILRNGRVKTDLLKSETIIVNGSIEGKIIATELLEVGKDGFVQGEIVVKNIKTQEGGRMIGSMATYEDSMKETVEKENTEKEDKTQKIVTPQEEEKSSKK